MNITISQEGMNPITVSTDQNNMNQNYNGYGYMSRESGTDGSSGGNPQDPQYWADAAQRAKVYGNRLRAQAQQGGATQELAEAIQKADIDFNTAIQNYKMLTGQPIEQPAAAPDQQQGTQPPTGGTEQPTGEAVDNGPSALQSAMGAVGDVGKQLGAGYLNGMKQIWTGQAINKTNQAISNGINAVKDRFAKAKELRQIQNQMKGATDEQKAQLQTQANNAVKNGATSIGGAITQTAQQAGTFVTGHAGELAAGATVAVAAAAAARFLGGTIFNAIASIGKFNSGNEMIASPKFQAKLRNVMTKFPGPYPSPQEVKSDPRAQSKVGFVSWLVGGGGAGKKIMNQVGSVGTLIKNINGITVAITTMTPMTAQSIGGLKVMLATAFVNKGGQLTSVPVARGFLAKGSVVNASREAADIYFDADGFCFKKDHIRDLAKKTIESFGPIQSIETSIINEYCI